MSMDGATRFANVRRKFFQNVNNRMQTLCQILRMVTIEIAISSALCLTSCRHCIAFEVMLLVSSLVMPSVVLWFPLRPFCNELKWNWKLKEVPPISIPQLFPILLNTLQCIANSYLISSYFIFWSQNVCLRYFSTSSVYCDGFWCVLERCAKSDGCLTVEQVL